VGGSRAASRAASPAALCEGPRGGAEAGECASNASSASIESNVISE